MKKTYNKILTRISFLLALAVYFGSCTKGDEYKKYFEGGETVYTGKIDSVIVYSGKERVYVTGLFMADPKIVKLKAFWNGRKDSIEVPIQRTTGVDTLKLMIPVVEGVHNFEFITFDAQGNKSLPVFKTGASYGARYISGLINRPVANAFISETEEGVIEWGGMDLTSGVFGTQVKYQTTDNKEKSLIVPIDDSENTLPKDYRIGTEVKYRTLFLPDTLSIDTFYTEYASTNFTRYVTSQYLKNTSAPFATSAFSGSRWGTPATWVTNTAVKNFLLNGVYYGGVDGNQSYRLTMEAGWSSNNLTSFTNGKIHQTTTLPAGKYEYVVDVNGASSSGSFFIAIAKGKDIPNIENLATQAKAYVSFVNRSGIITLPFELTEETELSFGFVGSLTGTGSTGQYWKVSSVKLKYLAR